MTQSRQVVQSTAQARAISAPAKRITGTAGDLGAARPSGRESKRASNIMPSRRDEEGGDSVLSRYFREMSGHQVMAADEELKAAEAVEDAEVEMWNRLLSYMPAAARLIDQLEPDLMSLSDDDRPDMAPVVGMKKLINRHKKTGKLTAKEQQKWTGFSEDLGRSLRMPDSDRQWMNRALGTAKNITTEVDGGVDQPPVLDNTDEYRKWVKRLNGGDVRQRNAKNKFVKANLRLVVRDRKSVV